MITSSSPQMRAGQSGITLVIALIMLTVLTLIGITVANMTTVDLKIATNKQASQRATTAAESGIDFLINNPTQLQALAPFSFVDNATETNANGAVLAVPGPVGSDWNAVVTVQRMGDPLPCPPASLPTSVKSIDSTTTAQCVYFEVTSRGTTSSGRSAGSEIVRGFYRKVGGMVSS